MSEYLHVEKTFLDQLADLGWTVIDQGVGVIPSDPSRSLRSSFREGALRVSCLFVKLYPASPQFLVENI